MTLSGTIPLSGVWRTDPRDGRTHAWTAVTEDGWWQSLCAEGVSANVLDLEMPEDEYGNCVGCERVIVIEMTSSVVRRQGDSSWRM